MTDFQLLLTCVATGLVTGGLIAAAKIALPARGR